MQNASNRFVPFHTLDRQWDARFNVPTDDDLELLLSSIKSEASQGKFRYALVGGVEIGDRPFSNDYLLKHVHVALVYNNRVSKSSILKMLEEKYGDEYIHKSGWTLIMIERKLREVGYNVLSYGDGTTHGRPWRDFRIIGQKCVSA